MVYLKLQPYKQTSMPLKKSIMLILKFYGSYKIIQRIGIVALIGWQEEDTRNKLSKNQL
jgi:hypothetical protein